MERRQSGGKKISLPPLSEVALLGGNRIMSFMLDFTQDRVDDGIAEPRVSPPLALHQALAAEITTYITDDVKSIVEPLSPKRVDMDDTLGQFLDPAFEENIPLGEIEPQENFLEEAPPEEVQEPPEDAPRSVKSRKRRTPSRSKRQFLDSEIEIPSDFLKAMFSDVSCNFFL